MSGAPDFARLRDVGSWRLLPAILSAVLTVSAASAEDRLSQFDIPAQSLADALVLFSSESGMTALIDGELAEGRRSSPVNGRLSSPEALQILLAGTGLAIRYGGPSAFTIVAPVAQGVASTSDQRPVQNWQEVEYFASAQSALERALCEDDETRPGGYRVALQIWIGERGAVRAVHFLSSTGSDRRDAAISKRLTNYTVAPPPPQVALPLTVVLQPTANGQAAGCSLRAKSVQ